MSKNYDVIVVGAGPAGSVCARSLGMGGVKVLLLDKERYPRDKPCGDFLSARLCQKLQKLGLEEAVKRAPHAVIEDLLFSHPIRGGFCLKESINRETGPGLVCKRDHLDAALFAEAKRHVETMEGIKIKGVIRENGQVIGVQSEDQSFYAKVVVGADGANGVMARSLGVTTMDENHHAVSVRSYYSQIKGLTGSVELHFIDEVQPGYFWIFPTNYATGEANVGLGILSSKVRNKNVQLKKLLEWIVTEHPQFKQRFDEAICLEPIKGWSLPFGSKRRPLAFAGALLIGDAGGLIDPMTGEGIENAVRSAECAVDTLLKALAADNFSQRFLINYEKALEKRLRSELRKGYFIQRISRNPTMLSLIFLLLKHSRSARRVIANKFF